jgi:hypothetical protein
MVLNEKGIIKQFNLVIYPVDFVVAIGAVKEELEKVYKPADEQYVGFGEPNDAHPCKTFEAIQKEGDVPCSLIWIKDLEACRGSYFCHEVGHSALDIFAFIGAKPDVDNQEPFTYLLGNLFRLLNGAFYEFRDYKPKKSKKK